MDKIMNNILLIVMCLFSGYVSVFSFNRGLNGLDTMLSCIVGTILAGVSVGCFITLVHKVLTIIENYVRNDNDINR